MKAKSILLTATFSLLTVIFSTASADAQIFTLLHYFRGAEGTFPTTGLVRDAAGNLYGTAPYGGKYQNCDNELGGGTVHGLSGSGTPILVHEFNHEAAGCKPTSGVILDPEGTVFEVDRAGNETVLHTNNGGTNSAGIVFKIVP